MLAILYKANYCFLPDPLILHHFLLCPCKARACILLSVDMPASTAKSQKLASLDDAGGPHVTLVWSARGFPRRAVRAEVEDSLQPFLLFLQPSTVSEASASCGWGPSVCPPPASWCEPSILPVQTGAGVAQFWSQWQERQLGGSRSRWQWLPDSKCFLIVAVAAAIWGPSSGSSFKSCSWKWVWSLLLWPLWFCGLLTGLCNKFLPV